MEKQVQVFMDNDVKDLVFDIEAQDEWKEKIKELGLKGQKELINKGQKSPIPFLYLNKGMERVLSVLCPKKEDVKEYSKTPIPLEALGVLKVAEDEGYFGEIEIWYDDVDPDPVMIGVVHKENKWEKDYYLLARCGTERKTLEQLRQEAKERWKKKKLADIERAKIELEQAKQKIDVLTEEYFSGEYIISISVSF